MHDPKAGGCPAHPGARPAARPQTCTDCPLSTSRPEHPEASSNLQYLFLGDVLVAPIYDTKQNLTTRSVWIPPGKWQDAWNGSTVTGPATLSVTLPFERVPMWHRAGGGLVLALDEPGVRVDEQDWGTITLHAWPELHATRTVRRALRERSTGAATPLAMATRGDGRSLRLDIGASEAAVPRGWRLRLQLPPTFSPSASAVTATIDGVAAAAPPTLLLPSASAPGALATPFGGRGALPAAGGGAVLELEVPPAARPRVVELAL